jgi:hypothetical protein
MTSDGAATLFEPRPACAAAARRFVAEHLDSWGLVRFQDEAAVCAAELASNAILHCRTPFTVAVRPVPAGVRIDVQDDQPGLLPSPVPVDLDPLASGTTGRGLMLVSAMSSRWGYFTTELAKTVWVELTDQQSGAPNGPLVELTARPPDRNSRRVRLVDLPVRAAVASGVQIDDVVRELQLAPDRMGAVDRQIFHRLLERSAAPRLIGRQGAFRASAQGLERYTLELDVSPDDVIAVSELMEFLQRLAVESNLDAVKVPPEVEAMREWLPGEVMAQFQGRTPSPFPGRG